MSCCRRCGCAFLKARLTEEDMTGLTRAASVNQRPGERQISISN